MTTLVTLPAHDDPNWDTPLNTALTVLDRDVASYAVNVLDHGAVADGASGSPTDNSPRFQEAINAAGQGGVVFIPPGHYRLGSPVVLTLGVTLKSGGWNPHFIPRTNLTTAFLRPATGGLFSGNELIRVDPAPNSGTYLDSAIGGGPRIEGIALHGRSVTNSTGGNIAGIRITSGVKDVGIKNVSIWQFTGDAVVSDNGAGMQFTNVVASTNGGTGFNITTSTTGGATDVDFVECYSQGNGGDGYILNNPNALSMIGCRAEFNTGNGYTFLGQNFATVLIGCNTDRSGKHGFNMTCVDGGRLFLLVGCQAKRDGNTAGSWAGFNITGIDGTTQAPGAVFQACSTYVGRNDDSTGLRAPAYGIQTLFTRRVQVSGGWYEATSAAFNDTTFAISKASGVVQATIDPTTGASTISNGDRLIINGSSGSAREVQYFTRGSGQRWSARATSGNETGSNAGSDYQIARFNDAGAEIDSPLTISRSTGGANFTKALASDGPSLGMPTPVAANGYVSWTSDPLVAGTSANPVASGVLLLHAMPISRSTTITKGFINISAIAITPTAASNWMGIYNFAGTLLGSVDITSLTTTAGLLTATFSAPIAVTPGMYWMGLLFNAATLPAPFRGSAALLSSMNGNLLASTLRVANNGTGQTTLPATINPNVNGQANAIAYWAAIA